MSDTLTAPLPGHKMPHEDYLNATYGIRSWLLTTDHKRIALLYLGSVTFFFFIGGIFATMIRIHLLTPSGALVTPETYNKLFTMHGVAMIFFFLIPSIPAVLGNFLIPLMIGAKDLAFPKINLLSWYIYLIGGAFVLYSFGTGGLDTGWTFYTPLSSVYSNSAVTPAVIGIFINGFSSILTGLNFIVTIHTMRAPGMTWFRLPLFAWAHYATSLVMVLGTPVIAITLLLAGLERMFHLGFFNPALGGDPILFQHLFWFYSHPAVYIMVLPAMGVVSEIIPTFARKPIFGYSFIAGSSIAIAVIGFLVWAHHMFVTGESTYAALTFSFLSYLVAIPSAVMGYVGGLHFWWPKITGRLYAEALSRIAAVTLFVGFNLTFFPQFILGYLGMPRRYHTYPPEFQVLNVLSTAGASILALGYLLPMSYLTWSMRYGKVAGPNPWPATGLEWKTASPPPTENFDVTPEVNWEPYDFKNRTDLGLPAATPSPAPAHGDD